MVGFIRLGGWRVCSPVPHAHVPVCHLAGQKPAERSNVAISEQEIGKSNMIGRIRGIDAGKPGTVGSFVGGIDLLLRSHVQIFAN